MWRNTRFEKKSQSWLSFNYLIFCACVVIVSLFLFIPHFISSLTLINMKQRCKYRRHQIKFYRKNLIKLNRVVSRVIGRNIKRKSVLPRADIWDIFWRWTWKSNLERLQRRQCKNGRGDVAWLIYTFFQVKIVCEYFYNKKKNSSQGCFVAASSRLQIVRSPLSQIRCNNALLYLFAV